MHILQVGSYLPPDLVGGAETSAQNLRFILEAAGHRLSSFCWKPAHRATLSLQIEQLDASHWAGRTWRTFEPITARPGLAKTGFYIQEFLTRTDPDMVRQFIATNRIDMIIVHSFRGFGYDLIDQFCQAGVPIIFVLHDFALVCMNKGMARSGTLCQSLCLPCRHVAWRNRHALARPKQVALVAPSQYVLDKVATTLQIAPPLRHHIPNPNTYHAIKRVRDHQDQLAIGYIGRLEIDKGVAGLLAIADRLHAACGIRLVIAGHGALAGKVAEFASQRPWVDFRGQVPSDQVHLVYDAIDVLTIPSLWPENFPGVAVHAMSSGLPCVGFAIGGIPEVIDDGHTGFVVAFGDFDALANRISELDRNRPLLTALSRRSLQACMRYDPAPLAQRWVALVSQMTAPRG